MQCGGSSAAESGRGDCATAGDGWLSKRRKLHTSIATANLSTTQTVVSRLVHPLIIFEFLSHYTTFLYRYFSSTVAMDDRSEQTPEGEGGMAATKTARKLQLEDDDDDIVIVSGEEREDGPPPLPSSSAASSPLHRSPFRKSPQASASSHLETDSEISVRKRLFPSNRSSEHLSSFQFSGSTRPSSSAKVGGKNPFTLLDQSQKFTGGADSENKKCFVLTNNVEDVDISSQENFILPQTDSVELDHDTDPPSQNSAGEITGAGGEEAKSSSFPYMTSKDFITAHPCTRGQPSADENPPVLQRSQSVAEMMLQPVRARATTSQPLMGNRNRSIPSTNSTKVCHPKI